MRLLTLSLKVTLDCLSANLWESEIITWACQHQRPVLKAKLSPALQQANLQIILHSFFYSFHLFLPSPIPYFSSSSSIFIHIHCTLTLILLSTPLIKSFVLLPCPSLCLPLSLPPCGLVLSLSFTFTELFGYTTFFSPFPPLQVRSPLLNFNTIPVWLMNK